VSVCASSVWFEIVMMIGPAPTSFGATVTLRSVITPVSSTGTGGRGFASWSSSPHPASSSIAAMAAPSRSWPLRPRVFLIAVIPRRQP
jgi:hypothetical protein